MSILELNQLVKAYPNTCCPKIILDNISYKFEDFGVIGLLGKNGAGKSTLIKCCTGLVDYEGEILYNGTKLNRILSEGYGPSYYSAMFEGNRNIYWKLSPIENIRYFSALRDINYLSIKDKVNYLLDMLNLSLHKNTLVERLSRGMQQKAAIAMALCFNTPVIFLDEPTLGLDIESRDCLISYLKSFNHNANQVIIVTSHDLDFISEVSKEILLLKEGKLLNSNNIVRQHGFRVTSTAQIPLLSKYLMSSINGKWVFFPTSHFIDDKSIIKKLLDAIAPNREDSFKDIMMQEVLKLKFDPYFYWSNIPVSFFLTLFCFVVGEYSNAKKYLKLYIEETGNEEDDYYLKILLYFDLLEKGDSENILNEIPDDILQDFSSTKELFSHIALPNCPNCNNCVLKDNCQTRPNFNIALKLINKMNRKLSQSDLRVLFES